MNLNSLDIIRGLACFWQVLQICTLNRLFSPPLSSRLFACLIRESPWGAQWTMRTLIRTTQRQRDKRPPRATRLVASQWCRLSLFMLFPLPQSGNRSEMNFSSLILLLKEKRSIFEEVHPPPSPPLMNVKIVSLPPQETVIPPIRKFLWLGR